MWIEIILFLVTGGLLYKGTIEKAGHTSRLIILGILAAIFYFVAKYNTDILTFIGISSDHDTKIEIEYWHSIDNNPNPDLYQQYIDKYPQGQFIEIAKKRLKQITEEPIQSVKKQAKQTEITPDIRKEEPPKPPKPENQDKLDPLRIELAFWESIKGSHDSDEIQSYLDKYPQGRFVNLAQIRLKHLQDVKLKEIKSHLPKNINETYQTNDKLPSIYEPQEIHKNKTFDSRPFERTRPVITVRNAVCKPNTIRAGETIQLFTDYFVDLPNNLSSISVSEGYTLKKDGKIMAELPPQNYQRVSGGWGTDATVPIPNTALPGTYIVEHKVQAGNSYDTKESVFIVIRQD